MRTVFVIGFISLVISSPFVWCTCQAGKRAKQRTPQAVVMLHDIPTGKVILLADFVKNFLPEPGDSEEREYLVRRLSNNLGITPEELENMLQLDNYSLIYTGDPKKIPASLRIGAVRPTTVPTSRPWSVVEAVNK